MRSRVALMPEAGSDGKQGGGMTKLVNSVPLSLTIIGAGEQITQFAGDPDSNNPGNADGVMYAPPA